MKLVFVSGASRSTVPFGTQDCHQVRVTLGKCETDLYFLPVKTGTVGDFHLKQVPVTFKFGAISVVYLQFRHSLSYSFRICKLFSTISWTVLFGLFNVCAAKRTRKRWSEFKSSLTCVTFSFFTVFYKGRLYHKKSAGLPSFTQNFLTVLCSNKSCITTSTGEENEFHGKDCLYPPDGRDDWPTYVRKLFYLQLIPTGP